MDDGDDDQDDAEPGPIATRQVGRYAQASDVPYTDCLPGVMLLCATTDEATSAAVTLRPTSPAAHRIGRKSAMSLEGGRCAHALCLQP